MRQIADNVSIRAVTSGPKHHFFGYYDRTPWSASGRYMLGMETGFMGRPPRPGETATVGLIDTAEGDAWEPLAETSAWHWQLGAMLQWMPPVPERHIIYNDRREGRFVCVVRDAFGEQERVLPRPVYALSPDGRWALSLNFARLAEMRPGYGYNGLADPWGGHRHPAEDGVWHMDLDSGDCRLVLSLEQASRLRPKPSMPSAVHWFNHVQISPAGARFAVLHRWKTPGRDGWETRMLAAAPDGSDLRIVADDGKVSHYDWRDDGSILVWCRQRELGERYFLFDLAEGTRRNVGEGVLDRDGHCSWSPDRRWILTDTYPDEERMRTLILYNPGERRRVDVGRFHAPPELVGPVRCDLHPRWSRDGHRVCVDSAHEGTRQMYVPDISAILAG